MRRRDRPRRRASRRAPARRARAPAASSAGPAVVAEHQVLEHGQGGNQASSAGRPCRCRDRAPSRGESIVTLGARRPGSPRRRADAGPTGCRSASICRRRSRPAGSEPRRAQSRRRCRRWRRTPGKALVMPDQLDERRQRCGAGRSPWSVAVSASTAERPRWPETTAGVLSVERLLDELVDAAVGRVSRRTLILPAMMPCFAVWICGPDGWRGCTSSAAARCRRSQVEVVAVRAECAGVDVVIACLKAPVKFHSTEERKTWLLVDRRHVADVADDPDLVARPWRSRWPGGSRRKRRRPS